MIHLFNPENDLALANAGANYVIHRHARQLRHDLALLPAWLAEPGDAVLVVDGQDTAALQAFLDDRHLDVEVLTPDRLRREHHDDAFAPWGWNIDLRRRLIKHGVDPERLPNEEHLARWRMLAHRRTTVAVHHALNSHLAPEELTTLGQIDDFIARHKATGSYLKAPWSGSGSGVRHLPAGKEAGRDLRQWADGVLRRQGSVLAERALDRVADLAVELHSDSGQLTVAGYSLFQNDDHDQYRYGIVEPRQRLRDRIASLYPTLDSDVDSLIDALAPMLGDYTGFLGVDMALYRDDNGNIRLNPCIEINLRMTMGLVTAILGDKLPENIMPRKFAIITPDNTADSDFLLTPLIITSQHTAVLSPF